MNHWSEMIWGHKCAILSQWSLVPHHTAVSPAEQGFPNKCHVIYFRYNSQVNASLVPCTEAWAAPSTSLIVRVRSRTGNNPGMIQIPDVMWYVNSEPRLQVHAHVTRHAVQQSKQKILYCCQNSVLMSPSYICIWKSWVTINMVTKQQSDRFATQKSGKFGK